MEELRHPEGAGSAAPWRRQVPTDVDQASDQDASGMSPLRVVQLSEDAGVGPRTRPDLEGFVILSAP